MNARLWLAVYQARLDDLASLTSLVASFCVGPARAMWGLPAPRSGERDDFLFDDLGSSSDAIPARVMRGHHRQVSAAHLEPVVNGTLLFRWLFPATGFAADAPAQTVQVPGHAFLHDSQLLAYRTWNEVEYLVGGLLDADIPPPRFHGSEPYAKHRNDAVLADLTRAQRILADAVGPPDDFGDYRRLDHGLPALDMMVALEIDEILRRDVHHRLVWLGDFEESRRTLDSRRISMSDLIVFDHGVALATVPESVLGLVLYDFAQSLRLDRATGRCQHCRQAMILSRQQASRARRGLPVFHPGCLKESRLAYFRAYQRRRGGRLP